MTVKELVQILRNFPQDKEVLVGSTILNDESYLAIDTVDYKDKYMFVYIDAKEVDE